MFDLVLGYWEFKCLEIWLFKIELIELMLDVMNCMIIINEMWDFSLDWNYKKIWDEINFEWEFLWIIFLYFYF